MGGTWRTPGTTGSPGGLRPPLLRGQAPLTGPEGPAKPQGNVSLPRPRGRGGLPLNGALRGGEAGRHRPGGGSAPPPRPRSSSAAGGGGRW